MLCALIVGFQYSVTLPNNELIESFYMQFECREFRESILGVMPHRWVSVIFFYSSLNFVYLISDGCYSHNFCGPGQAGRHSVEVGSLQTSQKEDTEENTWKNYNLPFPQARGKPSSRQGLDPKNFQLDWKSSKVCWVVKIQEGEVFQSLQKWLNLDFSWKITLNIFFHKVQHYATAPWLNNNSNYEVKQKTNSFLYIKKILGKTRHFTTFLQHSFNFSGLP